jgi:rare lipoprotein A
MTCRCGGAHLRTCSVSIISHLRDGVGLQMTAKTKPGSARASHSCWAKLAAAAAIPSLGALLAIGISGPAFAQEPSGYLAVAVPFSAAISPGTLTGPATDPAVAALPTYQTIGSGMASYYGRELAGNRTASGERFNPSDLTAAHRTLPLGSRVRVTNPRTGDSVIVRINDRGPFHSNRLIDLSEAAARQIGIRATGSGVVEIAVAAD